MNKSLDKMKMFSPLNRGIDVNRLVEFIESSIEMIDGGSSFDWSIVPKIEIAS